MPFENCATKDNYSYGIMVWQVAKDGEVPYCGRDARDIDSIKNQDRELNELLNDLPADTPDVFKDVIIAMTKYVPKDRASLACVREMMGLDETSR